MSSANNFRFRKPVALHHDEIRHFAEGIIANKIGYVIITLRIILNSGVRGEPFACETGELHGVGPNRVLVLTQGCSPIIQKTKISINEVRDLCFLQ